MERKYHGLLLLFIASLAALFLNLIPLARPLSYPFLLFSTFVHETCHALAAVFTLGRVEGLIIHWNGSGVTYTQGGLRSVILSAGYLGTPVIGGALLLFSRKQKWVRPALAGCVLLFAIVTASFVGRGSSFVILSAILAIGVLVALSLQIRSHRVLLLSAAGALCVLMTSYLFWKDTLLSWSVGLTTVVGLLALLRFASLSVAHFFLSFLGLQCSLNSLEALRMLYFLSSSSGCRASDAAQMATLTGLPAIFWAASWTAVAIAVLGFCFLQIFRNK